MAEQHKYLMDESKIPDRWVNIAADLPGEPLPPLNPGTGQPLGPEDLAPLHRTGEMQVKLQVIRRQHLEPGIDPHLPCRDRPDRQPQGECESLSHGSETSSTECGASSLAGSLSRITTTSEFSSWLTITAPKSASTTSMP